MAMRDKAEEKTKSSGVRTRRRARGMPASDPTFSLPTAAPGCPRTIQHPLPPASRDAPCPLYRSLSSQSTQRAPSSSLRAGTRTLSEPAGEASAPGARLPRIRGLRARDGFTAQTMNSKPISSFLSLTPR